MLKAVEAIQWEKQESVQTRTSIKGAIALDGSRRGPPFTLAACTGLGEPREGAATHVTQ